MIEVETKYRSPGNDKVAKALLKLEANKISESEMEDVYFSHPCRDFGRTDESLRLRKTSQGSELTYKGPRMQTESAKSREELTIKVDNPLATQRILERLGFREFAVIRKKRSSFLLDKLRVDIDDVEDLGEFVELEILTESPERAERLLELSRSELGLERLEQKTYLELLLERRASSTKKQ